MRLNVGKVQKQFFRQLPSPNTFGFLALEYGCLMFDEFGAKETRLSNELCILGFIDPLGSYVRKPKALSDSVFPFVNLLDLLIGNLLSQSLDLGRCDDLVFLVSFLRLYQSL